jgi:general stress protein YciG
VGKTPDTRPPASVRARVFLRHEGRCHSSGRKIGPADKWDLDHVLALCNGGENRETNLAPALRDKHREKTKVDVAQKAKVARIRAKYLGLKPKGRPIPSRPFETSRQVEDRPMTDKPDGKSRRGFASMSPERVREIARRGGKSTAPENRAFARDRDLAATAGRKGGKSTKEPSHDR